MHAVIDASRLQLLASQPQSSEAADVTGRPSHRAKIAQRWRLDVRVGKAVRNTSKGIPNTNAVDGLIGETGVQGKQH
jgi:hypothetical protein